VRPGIQTVIASTAIRFGGLMVVLLLYCFPQLAAERHRGAIVCRADVTSSRRSEVAQKLQVITGWRGLTFDSSGSLQLGADVFDGGSSSARGLIAKALDSDKVVIIEDASNRSDVVFARVVPGRWKNDDSKNPTAFVVMIDFADFESLMGDPQALEAFNVGWGLLHELDHVVNDSEDAATVGHVGQCEDRINQMRRECHLPARLDYFFTFFPNSERSEFRTRLVRLPFEQQEGSGSKKRRRFWVIWDATQVGGLDSLRQVATLR
jgi:hypothetical protein